MLKIAPATYANLALAYYGGLCALAHARSVNNGGPHRVKHATYLRLSPIVQAGVLTIQHVNGPRPMNELTVLQMVHIQHIVC